MYERVCGCVFVCVLACVVFKREENEKALVLTCSFIQISKALV